MLYSISSIQDPDSSNMYTRVLEAARARQVDDMLTRLQGVPNCDLVAIEARYHRQKSCYIKYISPRTLNLKQRKKEQFAAHNTAVRRMIKKLISPVLEHSQVFFLNTLRNRFREILADEGISHPDTYTSQHLKKQIMKDIHTDNS